MAQEKYIPRASKELDRKDIERAMRNTNSNKQAARYLGSSYPRYKKYALMFIDEDTGKTLFDKHKNQSGEGSKKMNIRKEFSPGIIDILEGRVNPIIFSPKKLKDMIISGGYLKEECAICGFQEKRILDQKVPLLLNFKDGNKRHWELNNLEFLCYNHYFLWIGDVFEKKQLNALEDYTVLGGRAIDFDLPADKKAAVNHLLNLDNKNMYVEEEKDDDYGNDLIVGYKK